MRLTKKVKERIRKELDNIPKEIMADIKRFSSDSICLIPANEFRKILH